MKLSSRHLPKWEIFWVLTLVMDLAYMLWLRRQGKATPTPPQTALRRPTLPQQHGEIDPPAIETSLDHDAVPATSDSRPVDTTPKHSGSRIKDLGRVAVTAGKAWLSHRAASKGAALALYTLFSLAPMLMLVVAIAGYFFGEESVRKLLLEQIGGMTGAQGADAFKTILGGTQRDDDGLVAGVISAVLVLISATTAFAELKDSLDELWEIPDKGQSGIWGLIKERFLSFGLILVLALMLMASLAVSTALAALENLWGGVGSDTFQAIVQFISSAVGFVIVIALFAVIFKYLPATRIAWKDVLVGALLTAILFVTGKALIGFYIEHGDISSSYGAAGSIVALITWIYYSAQIFFFGSLFTHEYAMTLGSRAGTRAAKQSGSS